MTMGVTKKLLKDISRIGDLRMSYHFLSAIILLRIKISIMENVNAPRNKIFGK